MTTDLLRSPTSPGALSDSQELTSHNVLSLIRLALEAPDLGSGVVPTLNELIDHTAAVGAAYFQAKTEDAAAPQIYQVRAAAGDLPEARAEIVAQSGLHFDPQVVAAFLKLLSLSAEQGKQVLLVPQIVSHGFVTASAL